MENGNSLFKCLEQKEKLEFFQLIHFWWEQKLTAGKHFSDYK